MKLINGKDVLHQLKADLIGKDSYRGVSLTYSWLANQFGHFSLGFIPALIFNFILTKYTSINNSTFWAALIVSIMWFLFELYNFLGPLLSKRISRSKFLFFPGKKYAFNPPWGNIAFDTFTDLLFFWFGAFSASLFMLKTNSVIFILIGLLLLLLYPVHYWFLSKMYLQAAQYPFQFRLSQWEGIISDTDKNTINKFLKSETTGNHLFVFGSKKSGKTGISVGIATEFSMRSKACFYSTAMKLYSMFYETDTNPASEGNQIWTWQNSELLVIDDINPGGPIKHEIVSAKEFLKLLDTNSEVNLRNRKIIMSKNVIWVLGNASREKEFFDGWKEMLKNIGVEEKQMSLINLGDFNCD